ncbi:MAG: aldo/keto reductase [Candidatus Natronoplasma sp.]
MRYREYKGLEMSEIGIGCYALSGSYGAVDNKRYKSVLKSAYEQGITLFDTAASYGEKAEKILGDVIRPYREEVVVSTKIGAGEYGRASLAYSDVKNECENSLDRLGIDQIDIYLVHFDDPETPVEETVEALDDLKEEGKIKHYGVSHLPVERVKEYFKKGDVSFCLMELSPVARQGRNELLPLCREHDVKAIAFSVTGRGVLSGNIDKDTEFEPGDIRTMDPLFKKERFKSALRISKKLEEVGKKYERTSTQLAINWVLSQEGVVSALTGPSSKEHLEENVKSSGWDLKEEDLREIEAFLNDEEEILEEKEPDLIDEILNNQLPEESEQAFNDLVYVMEVSIDRNMVEEKRIVPIFQELLAVRHGEEDLTHNRLEEIRKKVRDMLG